MDFFLTKLVEKQLYIFLIAGNHDWQERLRFCFKSPEKFPGFYSRCLYQGELETYKIRRPIRAIVYYLASFCETAFRFGNIVRN